MLAYGASWVAMISGTRSSSVPVGGSCWSTLRMLISWLARMVAIRASTPGLSSHITRM